MSTPRANARFLRAYGDELADRIRSREEEMVAIASHLAELHRQHAADATEMGRVYDINVQLSGQMQHLLRDLSNVAGPCATGVTQPAVEASEQRLHVRNGGLLVVRDAPTQT